MKQSLGNTIAAVAATIFAFTSIGMVAAGPSTHPTAYLMPVELA